MEILKNDDVLLNPMPIRFKNEMKLNYVTHETISKVQFCKSWYLLVSSWDGLVTLIDTSKNTVITQYNHNSPVLDCCFVDGSRSYSGSLDKYIISFDFIAGKKTYIGRHEDAVRCVEYSSDVNLLVTGGWDSKVKLWDTRMEKCIKTLYQPDRVFALSNCGDKIIVGTAGRKIYVWDFKNLNYILQRRESILKHQTRCIQSFPDKTGYLVSCINGRVGLEYLDPNPKIQENAYAFRAHRQLVQGCIGSYPVNAMAYHQAHKHFATAGSDGQVNIWDKDAKIRIGRSRRFLNPISSICYDSSGKTMAIASSTILESHSIDHTFSLNAIYLEDLN